MTGQLVARSDLTATDREAMFALLGAHFEGVTADQFEADLRGKNWIVTVKRDDRLVGFSTLYVGETVVEGELLTIVYSGDTIVSPDAWGTSHFPRAWINAVYQLRTAHPRGPLVWLLLTSGFRTYRFLPVFWQTFFPRFDAPIPPRWRAIRDAVASDRFGPAYDPVLGIVRFDHPQKLRDHLRDVPDGRAHDPHVAFFLRTNPGHVEGDELVCVADLDPLNLTPAGRRVVYGTAR